MLSSISVGDEQIEEETDAFGFMLVFREDGERFLFLLLFVEVLSGLPADDDIVVSDGCRDETDQRH